MPTACLHSKKLIIDKQNQHTLLAKSARMYLLLYLDLTMTWCKVLYLGHVHIFHSMPGNALIIITILFLNLVLRTGCSEPTDQRAAERSTIRSASRLCGFVIPFVLD
jgi:hypothetical protein